MSFPSAPPPGRAGPRRLLSSFLVAALVLPAALALQQGAVAVNDDGLAKRAAGHVAQGHAGALVRARGLGGELEKRVVAAKKKTTTTKKKTSTKKTTKKKTSTKKKTTTKAKAAVAKTTTKKKTTTTKKKTTTTTKKKTTTTKKVAAATALTPAKYYTGLVAFGASYTDNGHARAAAYAGSLRDYYPYSKYGGKYSNGKVAVEYMVSGASPALKKGSSAVQLFDYAYGGSVISNGLTGTNSATGLATDGQVAAYLADLASGSAKVGAGRVLHYFNTGINSVSQIWLESTYSHLSDDAKATATAAVSANIASFAASVSSINTASAVASKVHGADFMLVGIPPLEVLPTFSNQVGGNATELAFLKTLSAQFNTELKAFAATLKTEAKNGGKVTFYDLASLWHSLLSSPKSYGITESPVTTACYNSVTGGLCTKPTTYLYYDTLHPVTSVHLKIADKLTALANAAL